MRLRLTWVNRECRAAFDIHLLAGRMLEQPVQPLTASFYVVDPMGNAMLRFPASFDSAGAAKARRDLDQLLRASMAWDAPGR